VTRLVTGTILLALALALASAGCGGNAAVKSARRSLIAGEPRAAYAELEREARDDDGTDVLLALAEAAAAAGRDSVAHSALARVEERGEKETRRARETRERAWRALLARAQAVIDTLERATPADQDVARRLLERADRFDPGRPAAVASLGALLVEEGRFALADSLFALAVSRVGDDRAAVRPLVTALLRAASVYRERGRLEAAVALGRKSVAIAPADARARFDHGVALHQLAEATLDTALYIEAIEQFEAVLAHVPGDVDAAYNLALAEFKLGDSDGARRTLEETLPHALLDARVHRLAARLALARDDRDAARGHVVAMRALEGERRPIPASALLVSTDAGHAGAKRFVLDGPPERIHAYTERAGSTIEVWFHVARKRISGFSGGALVAEIAP
jgi:tetratricopeptide (TPR) repeat protein